MNYYEDIPVALFVRWELHANLCTRIKQLELICVRVQNCFLIVKCDLNTIEVHLGCRDSKMFLPNDELFQVIDIMTDLCLDDDAFLWRLVENTLEGTRGNGGTGGHEGTGGGEGTGGREGTGSQEGASGHE